MKKANKITLDFINSHKYNNIDDYLIAFKRCIWRYNDTFEKSLELEEFDYKIQRKLFNELVHEFNRCKYSDELKSDYNEPYFEFLDENSFERYLNYKKEKILK